VNLSALEQMTMLAILRLHPDAYGVAIQDQIGDRTGKEPSIGSVYAALDRLERKGLVENRRGEPTAERGGRAKLYFTLTASGSATLEQSLVALDSLRKGLKIREAPA
jgi:DNA-binding PadR family transcriptional regulator